MHRPQGKSGGREWTVPSVWVLAYVAEIKVIELSLEKRVPSPSASLLNRVGFQPTAHTSLRKISVPELLTPVHSPPQSSLPIYLPETAQVTAEQSLSAEVAYTVNGLEGTLSLGTTFS